MSTASELSRRLAERAEAVCRVYLPNGRRSGRYWIAGDVQGARGRSLFVKLSGEGSGRWRDAASGEYGDLIDLIAANRNLAGISEALKEARHFLRDPELRPRRRRERQRAHQQEPQRNSHSAAKLYSLGQPVPGTLAETYLRNRAITASLDWPALRFHPSCYYRPEDGGTRESWPAILAAVTDLTGKLTGLHRTWLARDGSDKAPFENPRRAMGHLLGNAVRFGAPADVMAAGEGIETVLSLLSLFPALPMAAALSAAHLAAILFPPDLRRLYVLAENDAGGACAEEQLRARCDAAGVDCVPLRASAKDLNDDLKAQPAEAVKGAIIAQLDPADISRFAG